MLAGHGSGLRVMLFCPLRKSYLVKAFIGEVFENGLAIHSDLSRRSFVRQFVWSR